MPLSLLHPRALQAGDTVALISPAGPIDSAQTLEASKVALEKLGFNVWVGPSAGARFDYLAGSDDQRLADLNEALRRRDIRGIFCTRGGYGAGRLVERIDYDAARDDPKVFAGFSDITMLHGALAAGAGWTTLHAPTVAYAYVNEGKTTEPSRALLNRAITSTEPLGSIREAMNWRDPWVLRPGRAKGPLIGGCLSVFVGLLGSDHCPDPEGAILVLEDLDEDTYRLDRYFTHLQTTGFLSKVAGVVLGQFVECEPDPASGRRPSREVIERCLKHLEVPVLGNFCVGHCPHNASLPFGCEAELDATGGDLVVLENYAV